MKTTRFKGPKYEPARQSGKLTADRLAAVEAKAAKNAADVDDLKKKGGAK